MRSTRTHLTGVLALLATVLLLLARADSVAQRQTDTPTSTAIFRGESPAVHFDVSPPLSELAQRETPKPDLDKDEEMGDDRPTGFEGPLGPQDADAIVQRDAGSGEIPAPTVSFNALSNTSLVAPPDPVGDVGPNHYVAMSNLSYAVYNKTGGLLLGPALNNTLWAGFGGPCQTENSGDPIVIYDQLADRWLLTQFTSAGPTFYDCVAISTSGNPAGTYYRYAFTTGANFPDYPKYGMGPNAYFISTREFAGSSFAGVGAYALNKAQMLVGNPAATVVSFLIPPGATIYNIGDGLLPADLDGTTLPPAGSPEYYVGSMDNGGPYGAPQDALTLWKFVVNFGGASSFTLANTIPVSAFDSVYPCGPTSRECIPQLGTTSKIDHLGVRQRPTFRLAYRNFGSYESLVTNQSVEATTMVSGVRWWEIRSPSSSPFIYQEGTYAPGDGINRWMGSIAQDQSGNMALGYSVSNATIYPGIRYTGRLVGDALGTMPQGEGTIVTGTGAQTAGSFRWGDYSSMNIDPTDDCTFWYINEYIPITSAAGWQLRVGSFKFPSCGTPAASATVLNLYPVTGATTGATARLWAEVKNTGSAPFPADARVWFWVNGPGWSGTNFVGYASVAGLAAGAQAWYFYDWPVPSGATPGTYEYWAQVWTGSTIISPWKGPQNFDVVALPAATVLNLWPVTSASTGGTSRLWAEVKNTGGGALPADARVWFWANGPGWSGTNFVGYASVAGLAAGAQAWYYFDWAIPAGASGGSYEYWGQVWAGSTIISAWKGPQTFSVTPVTRATILNLWPVTGAVRGTNARLWAEVKNTGSGAHPADAKVWFWVNGPGWSGTNWVGYASTAGLAAGAQSWYYYDWAIPAGATPGSYEYWGQAYTGAGPISAWAGPQTFSVAASIAEHTSRNPWKVFDAPAVVSGRRTSAR